MNPLLQKIAEQAAADLTALITEGNDDILAAIHKAQAESQLQQTTPKFALGFKIAVDWEKSTYECTLGWNLKQSLATSHKIDDPLQEKLPFADRKNN